MILWKLTKNFHSLSMTIMCIFQMIVESRYNKNYVCLEKSLNGHSVCQHLYALIEEKERRTKYITQLEDIKARMAVQEEEISMLKSQLDSSKTHVATVEPSYVPDPPNLGQTIMHELKMMWDGIRNSENKMQIVTSFMQKLDVEGVVNTKHTKKLNVRLDSMEKKLTKLTNSGPDSRMTEQIDSLRKALEIINETIHQNIRSEDSHGSLLEIHSNKLNDFEKLEVQVNFLNNGLRELGNKIQDVENKTLNMEQRLYEGIQSFWSERERTMDELEKWKTEWTSNLINNIQNPFASDSALTKNSMFFNQANRMLKSRSPTNQMPK